MNHSDGMLSEENYLMLVDFLKTKRKLGAVRHYRDCTGGSLKDSKFAVERIAEKLLLNKLL